MTVVSGPRAGLALVAIAIDVSEGGMCLAVDGAVSAGTEVQIVADAIQETILGEVRHLRQHQYGWIAGIRFLNFRWDGGDLWPENQSAVPALDDTGVEFLRRAA